MIPISKPQIGDEEKRLVMQVLDSGMLVQGPRVAELEQRWAEACQSKHAIAISNGTAALHTALLAHGIGPGDEVITVAFTFIASVNSIIYCGARPVFADIDPVTFNIDPDTIEALITPRTKAIMPVHLYGHPADMQRIIVIAQKHGLVVIEDAAQAIGTNYDGKPAGSFGTGCFSLYATKNVMSAEGGMITTSDDAIAKRCRLIRAHGMEKRYYHDMLGFNFRMSDLHAAIGLAQLSRLEAITQQRKANAEFMNANINNPRLVLPSGGNLKLKMKNEKLEVEQYNSSFSMPSSKFSHAWHQYTVRVQNGLDRDAAVAKLTTAGIGTGVFYPVPAHRQKHIREMGFGDVTLPVTEQLAKEVFSLPVHPALSPSDLEEIVNEVNQL
ncbi:MAG: DegT/DnrJ/EryC1/StrS family aminotransferase [Chloroflexi bacterium]|jgi:dTDP-4-amino-4,6-dideoxygalactose transaminase|nr:DegT/DnrJ/EryC1/StrS family aminotransferase [Chloroflexota bacterium]